MAVTAVGRSLLLFAAISAWATTSSRAAEQKTFQGQSPSCKVYSLSDQGWQALRPGEIARVFRPGSSITVTKPWKDRPNYNYWKTGSSRFAVNDACMDEDIARVSRNHGSDLGAGVPVPAPAPAPAPAPFTSHPLIPAQQAPAVQPSASQPNVARATPNTAAANQSMPLAPDAGSTSASSSANPSGKSTTKPAAKRSTHSSGNWYAQVSMSSWQETLQLAGPSITNQVLGTNEVDVLADPIGFCFGMGYRKRISTHWSWDANSCLFLGRASAADSSLISSGISYNSKDNFTVGLENGIGFLWNPLGSRHQLGIELPIILSHTSWSAPSGATVTPDTAVQTGVQIESRFYFGNRTCFDPKLAWLQTSHTVFWSLNFGFDLGPVSNNP
jgi:hypothetical protein